MRVIGAGIGNLNTLIAIHIGGVHKTQRAVARGHILGSSAHLIGNYHTVGNRRIVGAILALRLAVQAHARKRLVGVLASRDGTGLANGNAALGCGDVFKGIHRHVSVLATHDHELVGEHVLTRGIVNKARLRRIVHGARRGSDEDVHGCKPPRICSTRSPEPLYWVSAKVTPVRSV